MKHLTTLFTTVVILSSTVEVYSYQGSIQGKPCDANELEQCHHLESCIITSPEPNKTTLHLHGTCACLPGYTADENGNCVSEETFEHEQALAHKSASASSVAAGVLIPLTLIAAVGALMYFARRHRWWQRLRQAPARQYDTVLIGSQMDGDDDPPIS